MKLLDGDLCGMWRKEQGIDDKAECQCLKEVNNDT